MTNDLWRDTTYQVRKASVARQGSYVLLALYISLLAGRFSFTRLSNEGSTSSGIDLRFIFLILTVLFILAWWVGLARARIKRDRMVGLVPFGLWCAWLLISCLWTPRGADFKSSSIDVLFLFSFVVLAWLVMAYLDNASLERVWTWVLSTGVIYFVLALASEPDAQGRFAAPGGGPNTFVRIMVVAALAALYLVTVRAKRWPIATIPIFAVGAILSGSRGGILSAVIICLLFAVPLAKMLRVRGIVSLLVFGSAAAYAASFWRNGYVFSVLKERFIQQTIVEGYSSGRDTIIEQAWSMFLQSPIIGVGLNGFDFLETGPTDYGYAHNLLLSTLAETGLIGATLLVAALGRLVFLSAGKTATTQSLFALIAGLFFLSASMFSGDYYDSRFVWFFLALASITAFHDQDRRAKPAYLPGK